MKAYVIADVEVTHPSVYAEYSKQVAATVEKYGGTFAVRGGTVEPLEGGWTPKRIIVLEFPSPAHARQWYGSPEYRPLIALRQSGARGRLILVEGAEMPAA